MNITKNFIRKQMEEYNRSSKVEKPVELLVTSGTARFLLMTKTSAVFSVWNLVVLDSLACNYKAKFSNANNNKTSLCTS